MSTATILREAIEVIADTVSYSGRGMYGKECLGVGLEEGEGVTSFVVDVMSQLHFERLSEEEFEEAADLLKRLRTDARGLGTIVYWPRIPYKEEEEA